MVNGVVDAVAVVHEVMAWFEAHDYWAVLVDFCHDVSFVAESVGSADVFVVFGGVGFLSEFRSSAASGCGFVGVLELGGQELLGGELFHQEWVASVAALIVVVAVQRVLGREGHVLALDA